MLDERLAKERRAWVTALNYSLDCFEDEYANWYGMSSEPLVNFYIMRASLALGQSVDAGFLEDILELNPGKEVKE